ncbi:hypothetical protein AHAS_Ahas20G0201600 [Arachis hypogaea]
MPPISSPTQASSPWPLSSKLWQKFLLEQSLSVIIFVPTDSAFKKSSKPFLDLLYFHLTPLPLPPQNLRLLLAGAKIPTMLPGQSLVITNSPSNCITSLNNA